MSLPPDTQWYMLSDIEEHEATLAREPGSAPGWTTLGRLWLREGNFLRAEAAFTTALSLDPDGLDALLGRAEALRHIAPARSAGDVARAHALGWEPEPGADATDEQTSGTIYADVTDMIGYLAGNTVPSGIQRVVGNLLRQAVPSAGRIVPVLPDFDRQQVRAVDRELVLALADAIEGRDATRAELDTLLGAIRSTLRPVEPQRGDIFLVVGAFWIFPSYDLLKTLRNRGVAVSVFIHDIIPISHRYADREAVEAFRIALVDILEVASFVTTNSEFVATGVRHFLRKEMALDTPVVPVPLATELAPTPSDPDQEAALKAEYPNGYVLCVSTIEMRKNHIYLARIWDALIRSGRKDVPALVLVGKWDRRAEAFRDYLARTDDLGGHVRILSGVSNAMLTSLYRASRFVIVPSLVEGWGLPAGESLMLGKACLASAAASIPEVGGDLLRYFDPLDVASGLRQVTRLLDDPAGLAAWEADIRSRFRPRTWAAFAEELFAVTRRLAARTESEGPRAYARLAAGEMAVLGAGSLTAIAGARRPLRTARMAREDGWHPLSNEGAWSSEPVARLRFEALGCRAGDRIHLVIEMHGATDAMRIGFNGGSPVALSQKLRRHGCDAVVGEGGLVELRLSVEGTPGEIDGRTVYALLSRIGFHGPDGLGRLALVEEALIPA